MRARGTMLFLVVIAFAAMLALSVGGCRADGLRFAPSEAVRINGDLAVKTALATQMQATSPGQINLAAANVDAAQAVQAYIGLPAEPVPMATVLQLAAEDQTAREQAAGQATAISSQARVDGALRPTATDLLDEAGGAVGWLKALAIALGLGVPSAAIFQRYRAVSAVARDVVNGNDQYWIERRRTAVSPEARSIIEDEYSAWLASQYQSQDDATTKAVRQIRKELRLDAANPRPVEVLTETNIAPAAATLRGVASVTGVTGVTAASAN